MMFCVECVVLSCGHFGFLILLRFSEHVTNIWWVTCTAHQDAEDRNLTAEIATLLKDLNNAPWRFGIGLGTDQLPWRHRIEDQLGKQINGRMKVQRCTPANENGLND